MRVDIRTAEPTDANAVAALWAQAAGPTLLAAGVDQIHRLFARDPDALLVAVAEQMVVGSSSRSQPS